MRRLALVRSPSPLIRTLLVALCALQSAARAQAPMPRFGFDSTEDYWRRASLEFTWRPVTPCSSAPPGPLFRVPAFLTAYLSDTSDRTLVAQEKQLTGEILDRMWTSLDATSKANFDIDSRVTWRSLPVVLKVTYRKDGTATFSVRGPPSDSGAMRLLRDVYDAVRHQGGARLAWPKSFPSDTIIATFRLTAAGVDSTGSWHNADQNESTRTAFWLKQPLYSPALPIKPLNIQYPARNARDGSVGSLYMAFVIDTSGKAIPRSIHEARKNGEADDEYGSSPAHDAFVDEVRLGIAAGEYTPATFGGCSFDEIALLPVIFAGPR